MAGTYLLFLGWHQGTARRHLATPSEESLGSRRRKFGKITHGKTISSVILAPCRKLQPLCRKISGATPVLFYFKTREDMCVVCLYIIPDGQGCVYTISKNMKMIQTRLSHKIALRVEYTQIP